MKKGIELKGEVVKLRLIANSDKDLYYTVGFENEDKESEGVKRDAAYLYNAYRNIIIMSMLESDYRRVIASVE